MTPFPFQPSISNDDHLLWLTRSRDTVMQRAYCGYNSNAIPMLAPKGPTYSEILIKGSIMWTNSKSPPQHTGISSPPPKSIWKRQCNPGQWATHVQYCRTDTDHYLQLTVRKFRTDRHSCLRTVICGWQSVCFAQTVILAYGPLFAVDGPYVSHRPSFLLKVRIQTVYLIIAPGPTVGDISHGPSFLLTDRHLRLTVRSFRTDRHSYLQSEYRACISLSHQG